MHEKNQIKNINKYLAQSKMVVMVFQDPKKNFFVIFDILAPQQLLPSQT